MIKLSNLKSKSLTHILSVSCLSLSAFAMHSFVFSDASEPNMLESSKGRLPSSTYQIIENESCRTKVPFSLRQFSYDYLKRSLQNSKRNKKVWTTKEIDSAVARYSKVVAMAVGESSGNAACVADMGARGSGDSVKGFFRANPKKGVASNLKTTLALRETLLGLEKVRWTHQTNFGLLQMSPDRLNSENNRKIYARYKTIASQSPMTAMDLCGTAFLYQDAPNILRGEIEEAGLCKEGTKSKAGQLCFAKMVTICPALNFELALSAPAAYFATKNKTPRCASSYRSIFSGELR